MLEQLSFISEIAGGIVVIVTLVYLTIQVRQGMEALRSDTQQTALTIALSNIHQMMHHPEMARVLIQDGCPSLEEKVSLQFWIIAQMRVREFEWLRYRSGVLDEASWLTYRGVIPFVLGTNRSRALWDLCTPFFNKEFVAMVSELLEHTPLVDFWERLESLEQTPAPA